MCNGIILENGKRCPYEIRSGKNWGDCGRGPEPCPEHLTLKELEEIDEYDKSLNYYEEG